MTESASKIWRKHNIGRATPFKHWLTTEKINFYKMQKANGKTDMSFDEWLDKRYEINGERCWFSDGDTVSDDNYKVVKDLETENGWNKWGSWMNNTANWLNDFNVEKQNTEQEQSNPDYAKSNKVFGIPKVLFWGGIASITIVSAILIGKAINKVVKK